MRTIRESWKNVIYMGILLAAIFLLFQWYSSANKQRIEEQNLNYALDSAQQTALRINSEFGNALLRVRNYAYLLGSGENPVEITAELLKGMEEHAAFDAIYFTGADGASLTSDGKTFSSLDREYYVKGMQGESSMEILRSKLTGQMMTVSYAPIWQDGEAAGVLLGLYFAEDYLKEMLFASYFGEPADAFLCAPDGMVIASSNTASYDRPLLDALQDAGQIDAQTASAAWEVFRQGSGDAGFICSSGSGTDNLCVVYIPDSEYILVQAFPQNVTQAMIKRANHAGMILQGILTGLFAVYIVILVFQSQRRRRQLERESQEHITGLQEKERLAQAEIALANRKERQYRIAITATAFCTFEFNLTQDLLEQDILHTVDGQQASLLEKVGLQAPCAASAYFERWEACVLEESREEYATLTDLEGLRERFEQGEAEVSAD